ncbi:MAG TPA: flagellar biosynthetic protein FliO [Clostridia bacterium]|nr:flagellar biosynthetic protein FliO [Clostridia bacterium]
MRDIDFTGSLIKLFIALPVVVLIAYLSLRLANRYMKGLGNSRNLEVIETVQVYNKAALSIVRILDGYYVLGVTEHGVETIRELSCEEADSFRKTLFANERSWTGQFKGYKQKWKETGGNE